MIFVDTGAWFASTVPADVNHAAAKQHFRQFGSVIVVP